ncbi:hypothetical protein ONE63_001296 [Megalurothrips usitatus]|uniref:NADH dehydrogenase [ubiquinone] 1 beta subcomplex subunit 2, mitochondrial n=1 Tax=Megalurothrips usitatus TaxID=439358 RepID=A0AAV7XFR7_9NEOP|nr:hypothetical protein ONE63_001296 [Megalurothrips usitatus]
MLLSRSLPLIRSALLKPKNAATPKVSVRNSGDGFRYRNMGDPPGSEAIERATDISFTLFWYWVCYHTITKYDHLTGEFPWPDASQWTDEELGVPPDDYEPPNRA